MLCIHSCHPRTLLLANGHGQTFHRPLVWVRAVMSMQTEANILSISFLVKYNRSTKERVNPSGIPTQEFPLLSGFLTVNTLV